MPLFGKTFADYVHFARTILSLTLVVGILRLVLSIALTYAPTSGSRSKTARPPSMSTI